MSSASCSSHLAAIFRAELTLEMLPPREGFRSLVSILIVAVRVAKAAPRLRRLARNGAVFDAQHLLETLNSDIDSWMASVPTSVKLGSHPDAKRPEAALCAMSCLLHHASRINLREDSSFSFLRDQLYIRLITIESRSPVRSHLCKRRESSTDGDSASREMCRRE